MVPEKRWIGTPFAADQLQVVRQFLLREFCDRRHRDYFDFGNTAQVFVMEADSGIRQLLVIPKHTFDFPGFTRLLDEHLVTAMNLAGAARVILTKEGPLIA
jgi:hypothetical protein